MQYRNAEHSSTGKSPALLFKGQNLRTSSALDTTEVTFYRGNDLRPASGVIQMVQPDAECLQGPREPQPPSA